MAIGKKLPRLLCYDIADPKRLNRVHRRVREQAMLIQYSVYYVEADAKELGCLCEQLQEIINPKEDDIRIYPLPSGAPVEMLGSQAFGQGIYLAGNLMTSGFGGTKVPYGKIQVKDMAEVSSDPHASGGNAKEIDGEQKETETRYKGD